jgi:hypothetical protein
VFAFTIGGVRDTFAWGGFEGGIGADMTFYGVPSALQPDRRTERRYDYGLED